MYCDWSEPATILTNGTGDIVYISSNNLVVTMDNIREVSNNTKSGKSQVQIPNSAIITNYKLLETL